MSPACTIQILKSKHLLRTNSFLELKLDQSGLMSHKVILLIPEVVCFRLRDLKLLVDLVTIFELVANCHH